MSNINQRATQLCLAHLLAPHGDDGHIIPCDVGWQRDILRATNDLGEVSGNLRISDQGAKAYWNV